MKFILNDIPEVEVFKDTATQNVYMRLDNLWYISMWYGWHFVRDKDTMTVLDRAALGSMKRIVKYGK